jgi:hypothetical protein
LAAWIAAKRRRSAFTLAIDGESAINEALFDTATILAVQT